MRLILDIAFFMIVLVILVNAFMGMIIDTFGSLRAQKMVRMKDTLEVCFICNIDKQVFDRAADESEGFKTHVKVDHNIWNYLYFIFLLWEQDRDDDDGLEQYVRRAIDADEITWFPLNKAMRLESVANQSEIVRKELSETIETTQENVLVKLNDFQSDVQAMLNQLLSTLKQEGGGSGGGGGAGAAGHGEGGNHQHHGSLSRANDIHAEFDEDAMSGEFTDFSESSYVSELVFGKHISVAVVKLEGVHLFHSSSTSPTGSAFIPNKKDVVTRRQSAFSANNNKPGQAKNSARTRRSIVPRVEKKEVYDSNQTHSCEIFQHSDAIAAAINEKTGFDEHSYYHQLTCRIATDVEVHNISCFYHVYHECHIIYLDSSLLLPLFDNVTPHDKRKFQIQLLHGSITAVASPLHKHQSFLASIELYCKDLLSSSHDEEVFIEKEMFNSNDEVICTVGLRVHCFQAKGYGRLVDGEDDEGNGLNQGSRTQRSQTSARGNNTARGEKNSSAATKTVGKKK
jgi:hypothetical protein